MVLLPLDGAAPTRGHTADAAPTRGTPTDAAPTWGKTAEAAAPVWGHPVLGEVAAPAVAPLLARVAEEVVLSLSFRMGRPQTPHGATLRALFLRGGLLTPHGDTDSHQLPWLLPSPLACPSMMFRLISTLLTYIYYHTLTHGLPLPPSLHYIIYK